MKKITLSVLMLSFMLVIISIVGAAITGVAFNTPIVDQNISGTITINWSNTGGEPQLSLQYLEGGCGAGTWQSLNESMVASTSIFNWDTTVRTDGQYCLRIKAPSGDETLSGNFTIDNTAPNITFDNTPYSAIVNAPIFINATLVDGNLVKNYTIDFGDTSVDVDADVNSAIGLVNQSHTYNTSGQYTVTINARDNAGNSAVSTKLVTVNAAAPDWVIELSSEGMNMFSIPLIPEDSDIEEVLGEEISDNAEKIWSYQEGSWKYNTPTSSGWSTTSTRIQEIVPGYGYIIFMDNDAVIYGSGKDIGQDLPPEVTLTTGWNLIGHYGDKIDVSVDEAFNSLELGDSYWNSLLRINDDGDFVSLTGTENLTSTEAYWLSIKSLNLEENELRYFTYFPCAEAY